MIRLLKRMAAVLIVLPATGVSARAALQSALPWYRQVAGEPTVTVQYVRLTGHEADPASNTASLRQRYDACASTFRAVGHAVAPLPPAGIPPQQYTVAEEVYYGAGRTATYTRQTRVDVDYAANCALVSNASVRLDLFDHHGRCQIDLVTRTGQGVCRAGGNAAGAAPDARSATTAQAIALARIPQPQRAWLQQWLAGSGPRGPLPGAQGAGRLPEPPATGTRRRIAGVDCALYEQRLGAHVFTVCATDARSTPAPTADIVPSDLARTVRGVVLEVDNPYYHLLASTFIADLQVPAAVFEIPPGIRYLPR